jgi:hypothetical protein
MMGIDGKLKDSSGNSVTNDEYRYKNDQDKKPTLEEQRIKVEEDQKKLKQMEDDNKNKGKQKPTTGRRESMDDKEEVTVAGSPSPIFSLVNWFN